MIQAIVQARMGSTRLPGKVMMDLGGRPVLEWVVDALTKSENVGQRVTIATTKLDEDDRIAEWCMENGISCFYIEITALALW